MNVVYNRNFPIKKDNKDTLETFSRYYPIKKLHKMCNSYIFCVYFDNIVFQVNFTTVRILERDGIQIFGKRTYPIKKKNPVISLDWLFENEPLYT